MATIGLPRLPDMAGDVIAPMLWASCLCYVMKLVAHVGQQKLFGEAMGTRVSRAILGRLCHIGEVVPYWGGCAILGTLCHVM